MYLVRLMGLGWFAGDPRGTHLIPILGSNRPTLWQVSAESGVLLV